MTEDEISVNFKGGGSITSRRPVFSEDAENIFVCWKNSLLQYSTKTGKLVYEYKGLPDRVVGYSQYNYDSYECVVACSESGKVIVWKIITHFKILEQQLPVQKVETFYVIPSEKEDELNALISYKRKGFVSFARADIKKKVLRNYNIQLEKGEYFSDSSGNRYFSLVQKNKVYFIPFSEPKRAQWHTIHDSRTFTCVACHPTAPVVLTGDSTGRVVVWQNIFSKEKTQAVFHWHTLPVRTVSFSTSGSYFYSGGRECVLVKWQFDNVNDKQFLPRIAAEIEHISVAKNNIYLAVATSDNAVRILDSQFNQVALVQHLVLGKQYESGIIYDPRTKALIMNGNQGHIQFYSPNDMSLLYSVDIVGQNRITDERQHTIQNTEVTRVAAHKNGIWLATVEERKDVEYHSELRLKFWKFNTEKQAFELNTSIECPHEKPVNTMLFQPISKGGKICCVTLGDDKKFRLWQLVKIDTVNQQRESWQCFGVGFFRDLHCSALAFSVDGSLMAIGFEQVLTLWTPNTCLFKRSLTHPRHKEEIKQIQFGYGNQCHLIVTVSTNQLSVWNLLTLCMVWTVPVKVAHLLADPISTYMAVLTEQKEVYVFSPASDELVYSNGTLLKQRDSIVAAAFVPTAFSSDTQRKWYERSHLYFITSRNELYCLSSNETTSEVQEGVIDDSESSFMPMPNHRISLTQLATPHRHLYEKDYRHKTLKKFLESPIHTMAPMRYACYEILRSFVTQKDDAKAS